MTFDVLFLSFAYSSFLSLLLIPCHPLARIIPQLHPLQLLFGPSPPIRQITDVRIPPTREQPGGGQTLKLEG
ncbi:hypothetical protein B0H19DRAFT_1129742 [Mycena capillaripes]|nr:hypothetical protein B0H19DRAFT_1129742 [Mycena capillaripes]